MLITFCYAAKAIPYDTYEINETCDSLITPGYWDYVNYFSISYPTSYPGKSVCRYVADSYFWTKEKISLINYSTTNDSVILEYEVMFNGAGSASLPSLSQCVFTGSYLYVTCERFAIRVGASNLYVDTTYNTTLVSATSVTVGPLYNYKIILNDRCENLLYVNNSLLYKFTNCSMYNSSWYITGYSGSETIYFDNLTLRRFYNSDFNTGICLYDETNNSLINNTVYIDVITDSYNTNYSGNNGCVYINFISSGDYEFRYSALNYTERSYYAKINHTTVSNFTLYSLLNTTGYNPVIITVFDQSSTRVQKAQINVLRYFRNDTAQYKLVSMKRTNNYGEASLDLELYNTYYKFQVIYDDAYKIFDGPTQIFSTSWNYFINTITERFDSFNRINNILYTLDFLNSTNQFRLTYTDIDGLVQQACLKVFRVTNYSIDSYCTNCTYAVGAVMYCDVANISGTSYVGRFELKTTTTNSNYTSIMDKWVSFTKDPIFDKKDLFYGILFLITGALLGISMGGVGMLIMMFYIGIFIINLTGIISLTTGSIISIIVGVLVMIIIFKRRFP